jgi:NTP pyrophosphatase (non-canonical NTP hydrolase)
MVNFDAEQQEVMSKEVKQLQRRLVDEKDIGYLSVCLVEEMSELIKVLAKKMRKSDKFKQEDLEEELGHVLLMCESIKTKFHVSDAAILYHKHDALTRCFKNG